MTTGRTTGRGAARTGPASRWALAAAALLTLLATAGCTGSSGGPATPPATGSPTTLAAVTDPGGTAAAGTTAPTVGATPGTATGPGTGATTDPTASATTGPTADAGSADLDAHEIAAQLRSAIPTVTRTVDLTAATDPEHQLGEPRRATSATVLYDAHASCDGLGHDCGALVEVFADAGDARGWLATLQGEGGSGAATRADYHAVQGAALLLVSTDLGPGEASSYTDLFTAGVVKTPPPGGGSATGVDVTIPPRSETELARVELTDNDTRPTEYAPIIQPAKGGVRYVVELGCAGKAEARVAYHVWVDGIEQSSGATTCAQPVTNSVGPVRAGAKVRVTLDSPSPAVTTAYAVVRPEGH